MANSFFQFQFRQFLNPLAFTDEAMSQPRLRPGYSSMRTNSIEAGSDLPQKFLAFSFQTWNKIILADLQL